MTAQESLRIEWRGLVQSPGVEAFIRRQALRLAMIYPGLRVWRVTLEPSDRSRWPAGRVCASVEVRGDERQVILSREHEDAVAAAREAFDALFRQFDRRGRADRRASPARGKELRAA